MGYVLIGTISVSFLYEWILRRRHDAELLELLETSFVKSASELGLVGISKKMNFHDLLSQLQPSEELIWLDTYCPDLPNFQEDFASALARGVSFRILAIDPSAEVLELRALEIDEKYGFHSGRDISVFRNEAIGQIKRLQAMPNQITSSGQLALRLYRSLPCAPIYVRLRDGEAIVGYTSYFLSSASFDQPHLIWRGVAEGMLANFVQYFSSKWESAVDGAICMSCSIGEVHFVIDCPNGSSPR